MYPNKKQYETFEWHKGDDKVMQLDAASGVSDITLSITISNTNT